MQAKTVRCYLVAAAFLCATNSANAAYKLTCNTYGNTDFVTSIAIKNIGNAPFPKGKLIHYSVKDVKSSVMFHAAIAAGKSKVANLPNNLSVDANSKCAAK
jgi:hypothetical protein